MATFIILVFMTCLAINSFTIAQQVPLKDDEDGYSFDDNSLS
jgi:hypothetical protein